ncbi:class A beta-lactamase [Jiella avicenniae]|uniref:Beta-lactamase n=1 Tax=Jiella avicenniae TaxID=2907202 RepID=A0A9X1TAR9_9HYPH|nr:class A beta-lactamase [Jiella avicenniae]MCE7027463.1 class A beta-lactamase [Jiella avicenniae]
MFASILRPRLLPAVGALLALFAVPPAHAQSGQENDLVSAAIAKAENELGARVGAMIVDTRSGKTWSVRAKERFPLNSTFKAFACAAVLGRVDAGEASLDQPITFDADDLVTYSPVTETRVETGITLGEVCDAAMTMSDNTAGNLVIESLGGPEGVTRFMRRIGDEETRLDRTEPTLNEATPGDPRDTTTPEAAARSLETLVLGDALSPQSRRQLEAWLVGNEVGGPLLRAGFPKDWKIADRTGAGGHGSRSIVAIAWPPERQPIVAAIYLTGTDASMEARSAAIADIGKAIAASLPR